MLSRIVSEVTESFVDPDAGDANAVHSLLRDALDVELPLHVSLSRALSLPTESMEY